MSGALAGLRICVTGTMNRPRKELEGLILGEGGEFAKTCSAKTTIVMATEIEVRNTTTKIGQARKHKKPIVSEDWLDACLAAGAPVADVSPFLLDGADGGGGSVMPAALAGPAVQISGPSANQGARDGSQVMLAKKWKDGDDPTGWQMSEKLDGMRAYWSGENFFSRAGNQVHPPQWFVDDLPPYPLDGELFLGRGEFQRCMSIVRKSVPTDDWKYIKYLVFDAPKHESDDGSPAPFEERLKFIQSVVGKGKTPYAVAVGNQVCKGQQDLDNMLREVESKQGEGLMLRQAGSHYEWKRSSTLLKVKTFHDEEAIVISHQPGKAGSKNEHVLGALVCKTPDGRQFQVGSGFTDAQRANPPAVGSTITYRYQELSNTLNPRFPGFVDVRTDLVWEDYCEEYEAPAAKEKQQLKRNHTILFTEGTGGGGDDANGGASGGGAAPPAKKARKSGAAAAAKASAPAAATVCTGVQWTWQSSNGGTKVVWTPYPPSDNALLEVEWEKNGSKGDVKLPGGYQVLFGVMHQHPTNQRNRQRNIQRSVTADVVTAKQADGFDTVALYSHYKKASNGEPSVYAKNGTAMAVIGKENFEDAEWLHVQWQKTGKNQIEGWCKSRNITAAAGSAAPAAPAAGIRGMKKKKKKAGGSNPFAAKKVAAAASGAAAAMDEDEENELDGWEMASEEDDPDAMKRTSSAAAAAAADMAFDIAEDGIPDAAQFLLAAVAPPKLSAEQAAKLAAKYSKDRGIQPVRIAVPKDGEELVLGRGLHGITDPYMSSRQAALRVVKTASGGAALEFRALGRNACLYRNGGTVYDSGGWDKLAGGKKAAAADDEEEEGGSEAVVLESGDELCLLSDKTMRYKIVAAGVGGDGVNRSLTRSLTE